MNRSLIFIHNGKFLSSTFKPSSPPFTYGKILSAMSREKAEPRARNFVNKSCVIGRCESHCIFACNLRVKSRINIERPMETNRVIMTMGLIMKFGCNVRNCHQSKTVVHLHYIVIVIWALLRYCMTCDDEQSGIRKRSQDGKTWGGEKSGKIGS